MLPIISFPIEPPSHTFGSRYFLGGQPQPSGASMPLSQPAPFGQRGTVSRTIGSRLGRISRASTSSALGRVGGAWVRSPGVIPGWAPNRQGPDGAGPGLLHARDAVPIRCRGRVPLDGGSGPAA